MRGGGDRGIVFIAPSLPQPLPDAVVGADRRCGMAASARHGMWNAFGVKQLLSVSDALPRGGGVKGWVGGSKAFFSCF